VRGAVRGGSSTLGISRLHTLDEGKRLTHREGGWTTEQVRSDVTRYRYGDEQHLDEALKRIFRLGQVCERCRLSSCRVFVLLALRRRRCCSPTRHGQLTGTRCVWARSCLSQAGGIAKKAVPKLTGLREVVTEGMYTLTLEFDDNCPFEDFDSRQPKIEGFFGPGVKAVLTKTDAGARPSALAFFCLLTGLR